MTDPNNTATDKNQSMQLLMEQLASRNPRFQAIMEFMHQNQEKPTPDHPSQQRLVAYNHTLRKALKQSKQKFKRLEHKVNTLKSNMDLLIELNDQLAAALGACDECWGTDPHCQTCKGSGHPGAFEPDPHLFREIILPVVKQTNWVQEELHNHSTKHTHLTNHF